jgi:hypothetical protein
MSGASHDGVTQNGRTLLNPVILIIVLIEVCVSFLAVSLVENPPLLRAEKGPGDEVPFPISPHPNPLLKEREYSPSPWGEGVGG